ncbi:MAG: NUDIX domain-containing protein [Xanthomonadaceae bacterium]|nr:NUDIX domain-containing protein [Xanthomonadaceae bacterium]
MSKSRFICVSITSMNPFEQGQQKIIPATLIYAHHQGTYLMMEHKDGVWNGLGGKLELGESALQCAVREFEEESGIRLGADAFQWMGFIAFPNFKSHKHEDWWVHVFVAEVSDPGKTAHWKTPEEILGLKLWDGDQKFLPYVFKRQPFHGTFWYGNGHLEKFELMKITM